MFHLIPSDDNKAYSQFILALLVLILDTSSDKPVAL